jgi:carbamoyltransferase
MSATPIYVLGLSFDYHDSAAALLKDGEVVAAIQEERLTRRKHDSRLPERSIAACLEIAGIGPEALSAIAHYENPLVKFDRIVRSSIRPRNWRTFGDTLAAWTALGKFDPRRRIAASLGVQPGRISYGDHHGSHAAAAFYCSPFEEATIVTLDGVGEHETSTIAVGSKRGISKIASTRFPHSIGLFYSALTAYLGFEVNEGEYKVMGMAAFGEPLYADRLRPLMRARKGQIVLDQRFFNFTRVSDMPFSPELVALLGPARRPESEFAVDEFSGRPPSGTEDRRFADIAASVQRVAEETILDVVKYAVGKTGIADVVLAGGVGLNSLANARLQREACRRLYVQPAAGDAGSALGAALDHYHRVMGRPRSTPRLDPYLGVAYSDLDVARAVRRYRSNNVVRYADEASMIAAAADLLASGKVLGWLQGRFEWGPRALGNRSILANPALSGIKNRVNISIKYREPFRPFAPAVIAERAHEFFDLPGGDHVARPENYMLSVCPVLPEARLRIPAVVHADGSARVQLVSKDQNPRFHALISALGERTGIPVILNTSFNLRGEPIVSSPRDAVQTFEWSEMDNLVMENWIVGRPEPRDLFPRQGEKST